MYGKYVPYILFHKVYAIRKFSCASFHLFNFPIAMPFVSSDLVTYGFGNVWDIRSLNPSLY